MTTPPTYLYPPTSNLLCRLMCILTLPAATCFGAQVHSNGMGGGRWSDPDTWHGAKLPTGNDDVVISMRDKVAFDLVGIEKPSCKGLYLDPEAVLTYHGKSGQLILAVNGPIESYGTIKIDGSQWPDSSFELRLVHAAGPAKLILLKNASLLAYGRKTHLDKPRNVLIRAILDEDKHPPQPASIIANDNAMLDLHFTELTDIVVQAKSLDNTGNQSNERLNIIANHFNGLARLEIDNCDTPAITGNKFQTGKEKVNEPAVRIERCKLPEIRGNHLLGPYTTALHLSENVDCSVIENTIIGSTACGITWANSINAMIRENRIADCKTAMNIYGGTGVIENVHVKNATIGFHMSHKSDMQLTTCHVEDMPDGASAIVLDNSTTLLLNCNITDDTILRQGPPPSTKPWVQSMQYVVVAIDGELPGGAWIELRTAEVSGGVPEGKNDLNVRNSPAQLRSNGLTPLAHTMDPLMVRSWHIGHDGKIVNAPFYDLLVLAPADAPQQPPRVLKSLLVEPNDRWFRSQLDDPTPTLQVTLP